MTTPHRAYFDALVGFPELTAKDNPKRPEELAQKPDRDPRRPHGALPPALSLRARSSPCWSTLAPGIIPEHLLKGADLNTAEFNRKPVGTGPFSFVEWRRGERLVMEANAAVSRAAGPRSIA